MDTKALFFALVASLLLGGTCAANHAATGECKEITVDFAIKQDDPEAAAIEDDIRGDLAKIGIKVNTLVLDAAAYRTAQKDGSYNMMFTRTWGAPYDPHSYFNSWDVPAHVEYSAVGKLEAPLTRDSLLKKIADVQVQVEPMQIANGWKEILQDTHKQAIFLPLWGTRVPYVLNRRFGGFSPSAQTYEYPLDAIKVFSGSTTVTIAPGAGGGLFKSVGPVHPHQYFPNQLFAQAWVYEGLVGYGQDGEITPVLATSWTIVDTASGGSRYTFTLREGVKFHDGSEWNCSVAKLNFDHVLSEKVKERHGWLGLVTHLTSWTCSAGKFVLETKQKFYPLLQELTYIRPLRFAAASAFQRGLDSHPDLHNSCNSGDFGSKWDHLETKITCGGLKPVGTGPFKVVNATDEAVFARHDDYWGNTPAIQFLHLKKYKNTDEVMSALLSGNLDMALGIGPLTAKQVQKLKFYHSDVVDVRHSDVMQHALMVMNTNRTGTDDVQVRKAIIHAINKARFIEEEFAGLEKPVTQLLPDSAPYSNVDLDPKWAFDLEKAKLLNCPLPASVKKVNSGRLPGWAIALIVVVSLAFVSVLAFAYFMYAREKQGKPIFVRLETVEPQATFAPAKDSKQVAIDEIAFEAPGPAPASSHPSTAVTYDQD